MKITGAEDLRVQKSIKAIRKAFTELIVKKDYEKITVKELCEVAMINKKTFYQYYKDVDALLDEIQSEYTSEYLEIVKDFEFPKDLIKANREFFLYSSKQDALYEKITCCGKFLPLRKKMLEKVMQNTWLKSESFNSLDRFHQEVLLNHINTATVEMYKQWIESGKKIPLVEIIKLSQTIIFDGIKGFLRKY